MRALFLFIFTVSISLLLASQSSLPLPTALTGWQPCSSGNCASWQRQLAEGVAIPADWLREQLDRVGGSEMGKSIPQWAEPTTWLPSGPGTSSRSGENARLYPVRVDGRALLARYGSTAFPSVEAMPEELRLYFLGNVQEVADFFGVRPGDMIAFLRATSGDEALRLQPPSDSGERGGIVGISPELWNGVASPEREAYHTDLRLIEQYGGVGFDWSLRHAWRSWQNGEDAGSSLVFANAEPSRFENSLAAAARFLARQGVTTGSAAQDRQRHDRALANAIAQYRSGTPLSDGEYYRALIDQAPLVGENRIRRALATDATSAPTWPAHLVPELREGYIALMDRHFARRPSERELQSAVDRTVIAAQVAAGRLNAEEGAAQLFEQRVQQYLHENQSAIAEGRPLGWPFIYDRVSLAAQRLATQLLGHTLAPWELEALVQKSQGETGQMIATLSARPDASLFEGTMKFLDEALKRRERGLPLRSYEATALLQRALEGNNPTDMSQSEIERTLELVKYHVRRMPEYRALHGVTHFSSLPMEPMPGRVLRKFGAPVRYQTGGKHTGVDFAGRRIAGKEPLLLAVEDGTVVHVGPLYCNRPRACRGPHAIILDHGNHLYSIYSHNSEVYVQVGNEVKAGQPIGRQGNEGYSFGSHLHLEVHRGAPFSGDWTRPFYGGEFVDPVWFLPKVLPDR